MKSHELDCLVIQHMRDRWKCDVVYSHMAPCNFAMIRDKDKLAALAMIEHHPKKYHDTKYVDIFHSRLAESPLHLPTPCYFFMRWSCGSIGSIQLNREMLKGIILRDQKLVHRLPKEEFFA